MIDVNVAKCRQSGIDPGTVLTAMQGYYGGLYASNFNSFGKLYRVMIQADPKMREDLKSMNNIYVRTASGMAPINEFVSMKRVYGPQEIARFNLFTSIDVNATAAEGYSSGDAIRAVEEVASNTLPTGFGYEFSGLTRSEQESSSSTMIIFALCLTFVYLILSAQVRNAILCLWSVTNCPFRSVSPERSSSPTCSGKQNDIYMQIALIMLIGLLAKNDHPYRAVRPRTPQDGYGTVLVVGIGRAGTSASYPHDIVGYDYRSYAVAQTYGSGL
mgnify:CR=1 FL=1